VPEYLSPGVYVEEIELGQRPIEGVSTSTAGIVGVAERGPEDVPILITSYPEYQRTFGGYLDPRDFPDTWYLPYAAEGFFQNGGQRVYVVRVASPQAVRASVELMNRGTPDGYSSPLEVLVSEGDTFLLVADTAGLAGGSILRIDDGAATEYVTVGLAPFPATNTKVLTLRQPTYAPYAVNEGVTQVPIVAPAAARVFGTTLSAEAVAGSTTISVAARPAAPNDFAPGDILELEAAGPQLVEYAIVELVPTLATDLHITIRHPLAFDHANGATVDRQDEGAPGAATYLDEAVPAGSSVIVAHATAGIAVGSVIRFGGAPGADAQSSYAIVANLEVLSLGAPALNEHLVAETVTQLQFAANPGTNGTAGAVAAGDQELHLTPGDLAIGDWVEIGGAEFAQVEEVPGSIPNSVRLRQPVQGTYAAPVAVVRQNRAAGTPSTRLLQGVHVGGTTVLLADGAPFAPGLFVEIGDAQAPNREYQTLGPVGQLDVLPLAGPATRAHRTGTPVQLRAALFEVDALDRGAWGNGLQVTVDAEDPPLVQTTTTGAGPMANVPVASMSGIEAGTLLEFLEVSTTLTVSAAADATSITVASTAGIGPGTRLRVDRTWPEYVTVAGPPAGNVVTLTRPLGRSHGVREAVDVMDITGLPRMAKVERRIGSAAVRLDGGGLPGAIAAGTIVRSCEFKLTVTWKKPNPRLPSNLITIDGETHRYLTLDDRHSRYAPRIVGSVNGPIRLWDRRTDGASDFIRINDPDEGTPAAHTQIRPGPDLIYYTLPSGKRADVPIWLAGGDDDNANVVDDTYRGLDNIDPVLRTGIQALKNDEDISLVAIPGRTSDVVQEEVIDHCELMRYRFALLDSIPGTEPTGAQLPEVQAQRQQFDSKYAALYYPWVLRESPFPQNPAIATDLAVPPVGHMLGIYARTDVTRGVHKAPANEVISGVSGLQRALTKGEHDVLNPYPTNINVLRDFRLQSRGLRVWGARVITSDPEWRYVNVRRLFNYVERSLELGTQWTVFEPNDQNLWAQVRRSISNFLNLVWRSGGLMGATAEEAYFVKCDTTTMTQADIDAGRLIVVIGIAPTKPAEFVVIRIGQWSGGSTVDEG
jgi:phage tail sheath protein FI